MPVGITKAFNAREKGLNADDIENHPSLIIKPLRCGGCSCPVTSVNKRSAPTSNSVGTRPYFRRLPGKQHDAGCRYDFNRRAGELQTEHAGVIVRSRTKWVLMLGADDDGDSVEHNDTRTARIRSRIQFFHTPGSERRVREIRAARDIASMLSDFDDLPENMGKFQISYAGRQIRWDEFFYRADKNAKRLYEDVQGDTADGNPRVVAGQVRSVKHDNERSSVTLAVRNAGARYQGPVRVEGVAIIPVVRKPGSLDLPLEVGDEVLAYGQWTVWSPPEDESVAFITLWTDKGGSLAKLTG